MTATSKATAGPMFSVSETNEADDGTLRLLVNTDSPNTETEADKASALIEAAPDLRDALAGLMAEIDAIIEDGTLKYSDVESNMAWSKARAALAKAERK